jgi:hypothetical protein
VTLPHSFELDVAALSRLFDDTATSYKFIFFISYLDILRRRDFSANEPVSFRELTVEMLANSWYPHTYFKLSFGLQDKIASKLDSLNLEISQPILNFRDTDKTLLRQTINNKILDDSLMRFVPYRLLRPFFEEDLIALRPHNLHSAIAQLAAQHFTERKPLYCFGKNRDSIIPHPVWVEYLRIHHPVIKGWAAWKWLEYMQRRNQGVPAVSSKLFPPQKRDSLKTQTEYWKLVLKHSDVRRIYTEERLSADKLALDHYLPWSFVSHDQLWNLIPTLPEVNSSKSDHLPEARYFDRFVSLQHQGLIVANKNAGARDWNKYIEPYLSDLRFSDKLDLLDREKLDRAYKSTLLPMLELAKNLGFSANWRFRHMPSKQQ